MPSRLRARLSAPVDAASLGALRALFGALMLAGVVRFAARGWIDSLYLRPTRFFPFVGFAWVRPLPPGWMYALFALMGAAALGLCLGWRTRASALTFALAFTYVELIDKTNYLNHYYLVSLLAFLLAALPSGAALSLDARRDPRPAVVPAWTVWLLRAQLGLVYFFAGVAKLNPDWLLRAEPVRTWLLARADLPLLGSLFRYRATAFAFSYAGAAFDLGVAFALCHRRARPWAYAAVVAFHLVTGALFRIGIFPWVMIACTTIFFDPAWPRRWVGAVSPAPDVERSSTRRLAPGLPLAAAWLAVQALLPLRFTLYPGEVLWTEQGFRLAWRVMLTEKSGDVEFRVRDLRTGQRWTVLPSEFLTPLQARAMVGVPDMIVQAAGMVRDDFARRGHPGVEVRVDAFASLNGRPARRIVDPDVDLGRARDSFAPKPWIRP